MTKPSFGHKGDSDAGARLLWFAALGGGGFFVVWGIAIILITFVSPKHDLGDALYLAVGILFVVGGTLFLGALGYIRKRFGKQ